MPRLLVMLCPPRSYSSLISTMIGQHPQIYGFPELHIMMRETVAESLERERQNRKFLGPPGLLRVLAELEFGGQTEGNILSASNWLEDRADWKSKDVLEHLMSRAAAVNGVQFCLEKTPMLPMNPRALKRVKKAWPDALYIHVTRHPVALNRSLEEFITQYMPRLTPEETEIFLKYSGTMWPVSQRNILDFCASLAPGQYIRIRGEDVLSDAGSVMRQIADWLGLDTGQDAVGAMLRPEDSPYARLGPANAAYGNDPKFISSPKFRPGNPRTDGLKDYLETGGGRSLDAGRKAYLRQLAGCLGYQ